jgi:hypothetical protein
MIKTNKPAKLYDKNSVYAYGIDHKGRYRLIKIGERKDYTLLDIKKK